MTTRFYTLRQEQWISRPIEEVFSFFSNAQNLETITPSWIGFKIISMSTPEIVAGTQIRYRLKLHGIPIHWRTEILHWNPPYSFTDIEREGPYKLWHHTHRFIAHGKRTQMLDCVRYSLPFGPLGRLVHTLKVGDDVKKIFAYRRSAIDSYFPAS
jgi:ligand-binding SRPBCC domain-containing protein